MMKTPKGVAMVLAGYHPYVGGAEGQAQSLAAALRKKGIWVWVATRALPGTNEEDHLDGVLIKRLPAGSPVRFMTSVFFHLLGRSDEFDVVHAHLASSHAVAAAAAGRLLRKRVIVKLGGGAGMGEIKTSQGFLGQLKLKALKKLKPTLVAPNPDIFKEVPGTPLEGLKQVVIPNGVDLNKFAPLAPVEKAAVRKALGWPAEGFALLSASRLADDKGVATCLNEFISVWASTAHPTATLYIAGTGPEEAHLKRHSKETGARAHFLGARHDIHRVMQAADGFLLPSKTEGMSNALLEALACGLPVLATGVSGTKGLIQDNVNGLLYHPGDYEGLSETLKRFLSEPGLHDRLAVEARKTAEQYSLDKTVDQYIKLYVGDL